MLNALRIQKTSFAAFSLAALLLTCAPKAHADNAASRLVSSIRANVTAANAAYTLLGLALFRYWSREPDKNPAQYNLDELFAGENIADNLWYLVDDGIIGHSKKSGSVRANPDNEFKIETGPGIDPKGLMGWAHAYWKPLLTAVGGVWLVKNAREAAATSSNFNEFMTKFNTTLAKKFSDLGLPVLVAGVFGNFSSYSGFAKAAPVA